jgi:hypothetical protein
MPGQKPGLKNHYHQHSISHVQHGENYDGHKKRLSAFLNGDSLIQAKKLLSKSPR